MIDELNSLLVASKCILFVKLNRSYGLSRRLESGFLSLKQDNASTPNAIMRPNTPAKICGGSKQQLMCGNWSEIG
jgi:hypothetical protein